MEHTPDQKCHQGAIGSGILSVVFGSVEPTHRGSTPSHLVIQSRHAIRSAPLDIPLAERNVHRAAI